MSGKKNRSRHSQSAHGSGNPVVKATLAEDSPPHGPKSPVKRGLSRRAIIMLSVVGLLLLSGAIVFADWWICLPEDTTASYVGTQTCIQCHADQGHSWKGSHHDLAMKRANKETVLGDFSGVELEHLGVRSKMFLRDDKFWVHTEGPDGKPADFEVKYVLGVDPLQQYMVEFDRDDDLSENEVGRLQVLRISWDTKQKKWFHLDPPRTDESPAEEEKLAHDDELHWTGIAQRWNTMCAECHSTNLQKNFDVDTRKYHTSFSEINVGCEACHGPGSVHVKLANKFSLFWDRKRKYGLPNLKGDDADVQIQACAQCHARQGAVKDGFHPGVHRDDENYYDYWTNTLLMPGIYHADGQVLDEDYVFGSYLQSKMYHKGIRCSDCHDPHTARLKHQGNKLCTSCHQHPEAKYDTFGHHHHKAGTPGASCVECHMPETTYMEVDPRRDHSLRVPRPDLSALEVSRPDGKSAVLGTPNACTRCHIDPQKLPAEKRGNLKQYADWIAAARRGDKEIQAELTRLDKWAAEAIEKWTGKKPDTEGHFAVILDRVWNGEAPSSEELIIIVRNKSLPAIVRASAAFQYSRYGDERTAVAAGQALEDAQPQVRAAAVSFFQNRIPDMNELGDPSKLQPQQLMRVQQQLDEQIRPVIKKLAPLLDDEVRLVRTEGAMALSGIPQWIRRRYLDNRQQEALAKAYDELVARLMIQNDHAQSHLALGSLHQRRGDGQEAIEFYRRAIHVEPRMLGSRRNLASLLESKAERLDIQMREELFSQIPPFKRQDPRLQQQFIAAKDLAEFFEVIKPHLTATVLAEKRVQEVVKEMAPYLDESKKLRRHELDLLARRARLLPNSAESQYEYGLSLSLHDQPKEALAALLKAHQLEPNTPQFLLGLTYFYQKHRRWNEALAGVKRLIELRPDSLQFRQLQVEIRQQAATDIRPDPP